MAMAIDGRWLKNFRETELWETPDSQGWLMKLPQFTFLRQEADQDGQRIKVLFAGDGDVPAMTGWATGQDLGPVGAPGQFPPPQPGFSQPPGGGGPFLSNFRETELHSSPTNGAVLANLPQFSTFAQLVRQDGDRILAYYYGNNTIAPTPAWLLATDLGPIPQPVMIPPPEPGNTDDGGGEGPWTPELGAAIAAEDLWDPNGQPRRRTAMEQFNHQPFDQRLAVFQGAMDAALSAEGITNENQRSSWMLAMRLVVRGGPFGGTTIIAENPDLNPFILAGESGGVFRGGATVLNSAALGYFQFIATNPNGSDFGHWTRFMPDQDRAMMTRPTSQIQEFIRAVRLGRHQGDPFSVVQQKADTGVWGP
jgi:hypothetical protein